MKDYQKKLEQWKRDSYRVDFVFGIICGVILTVTSAWFYVRFIM